MELEKTVFPNIANGELVERILNDVLAVMDMKNPADLHLMRKLKYISTLVEIVKRVGNCNKT